MGIQEDIFKDFFDKLKKDTSFPDEIVKKLRKLWESGEMMSKEKILDILAGGIKNKTENQNH